MARAAVVPCALCTASTDLLPCCCCCCCCCCTIPYRTHRGARPLTAAAGGCGSTGAKNASLLSHFILDLVLFYHQNDRFTKTGSGQTYYGVGKTQKETCFFRRPHPWLRCPAGLAAAGTNRSSAQRTRWPTPRRISTGRLRRGEVTEPRPATRRRATFHTACPRLPRQHHRHHRRRRCPDRRRATSMGCGRKVVRKNAFFFLPFDTKDDHFAKTGSGQTEQKLKTNVVIRRRYSQGSVSSAAGAPVRASAAYLARCACGSTARQWSQMAPPPSTARRQETTAMWCRWRARRSRRVRIGSMWSASTRCATSGQSSRTRRSAPKVGRARRAEE